MPTPDPHRGPDARPPLRLEPAAGPPIGPITIARDAPATIGRAVGSDVCLLHEGVSRRHASVRFRASGRTGTGGPAAPDGPGRWFITDLGSAGGTFLGGVRLRPHEPTELAPGDALRVGPWTFRVAAAGPAQDTAATRPLAPTLDDHAASALGLAPDRPAGDAASLRLEGLIDCTLRLMDAPDPAGMARIVLDAALAGTGFPRGAVLRPAPDAGEGVEVVAAVGGGHAADAGATGPGWTARGLSRSLVREASRGRAASLTGRGAAAQGPPGPAGRPSDRTTGELEIHSAVCVPATLGGAVMAVVYLDARGAESCVRADALGYCAALARVYGMALGSAARAELEGRRAALEAELRAAREAQELIMPPRSGAVPGLRYAVRGVAGRLVAGDLFDAVELGDGRVAVSIGDVSGHGAGPAIMMASTQAYLNAALAAAPRVADAVSRLNRYVCARSGAGRFVSLWSGVIDPAAGTLAFVDAGHGHWMLAPAGGAAAPGPELPAPRGIPLGIDPAYAYPDAAVPLRPGDRLVLYSDGLVEQRSPAGEEFGRERVRALVAATLGAQETADALLAAVEEHAGRAAFDDDTTVAVVEAV